MMHRGRLGDLLLDSENLSAGIETVVMYARVHDSPPRAHVDLRLSEVKAERVDNDQGHLDSVS